MDSVRNINVKAKEQISAKQLSKELAADMAEAAKTFLQFLLYAAAYALDAVYRAVKSEAAAYFIGKYKKVLIGVSAVFVLFAAIGIAGGMEAGLISFGIGFPLSIGLFLLFRLLGKR